MDVTCSLVVNVPAGYEAYNHDWCISPDGDLVNIWNGYEVGCDILGKEDLLLHLMDKHWFNVYYFIPAYFEACRRSGLNTIQVRVSY